MAAIVSPQTKTLVVVILDESGSMGLKKSDVIGGYNEFLEKQRDERSTDETRLSLIKFNTVTSVIHEPMGINTIPNLSNENYCPGGGTALFDAIAEGVRVGDRFKLPAERVLCLIMTDGEENSSRETALQQVRDIIAERESRGDWTFAYIGEQPERWSQEFGLQASNMASYSHQHVRGNFSRAAVATHCFLQQPSAQMQHQFFHGGPK